MNNFFVDGSVIFCDPTSFIRPRDKGRSLKELGFTKSLTVRVCRENEANTYIVVRHCKSKKAEQIGSFKERSGRIGMFLTAEVFNYTHGTVPKNSVILAKVKGDMTSMSSKFFGGGLAVINEEETFSCFLPLSR